MIVPGSINPLLLTSAAAAGGFQVSRSLRYNAPDSAYLNRTPSVAGNRKIFTFSCWVKLGQLGTQRDLFSAAESGTSNPRTDWRFDSSNNLTIEFNPTGSSWVTLTSSAVYRDTSAWYHVVVAVDTTQATSSDRTKVYINNVQQTMTGSYVSQNTDLPINNTWAHSIGRYQAGATSYFDGYLANVQMIDGQQLTPSSFTEVSATTGQLIPKAFSGSYGLVADSTGALPIFNTTGAQGAVKGTGTRTDTNSASIVLAVPMDGTNGGTSFGDQSAVIRGSGSAKTVTVNGNTNTSTAQSKFYGSSGSFDGTGDYLSLSSSADFQIWNSTSWTVECFIYINSLASSFYFFGAGDRASTTTRVMFSFNSSGNFILDWDGTSSDSTTTFTTGLSANNWYHLAVVSNGTTCKVYINGAQASTTATLGTSTQANAPISIGVPGLAANPATYNGLNGYIQDFRIYKGVAKYTSNFIVPTPNSFYLQFADNSSNTASTLGKDTSGNGNNWTPVNFQVSGTPTYSNYLTSTYTLTNAAYAFDGDYATYAQDWNGIYNANYSYELTFTPPTPIPYNSLVEVYTIGGPQAPYYNRFLINTGSGYGSEIPAVQTGWATLASGSGSISGIKTRSTQNGCFIGAIRIDGTILVQSPPSGIDSTVDTPTSFGTDTSVGGEVRGNYATLNPLQSSATLSNGNLDCTTTSVSWQANVGTIFQSSGKWYSEVTVTSIGAGGIHIGIVGPNYSVAAGNYIGNTATSYAYRADGTKYNNGSAAAYGATYTTNDVIGIAMDLDAGSLVFYKNGASQGTAYTSLTGEKAFAVSVGSTTGTHSVVFNFGQRAFAYTAPSGFKALCDTNLPAPLTAKPNTVMDVALYTGNGGTQSITGLAFRPDLVWIKARSTSSYNHFLFDAIRDVNNELNSNTTDSEYTRPAPGSLTAFNSDGFALNTAAGVNSSGTTYVAWCWDAGTTTTTINANAYSAGVPSITSQVRANVSAGFSVVSWTAGSAPVTMGHGLGVAPQFIIMKSRTSGAVGWQVGHASLGWTKRLFFDTAASDTTIGAWNDTAPTSTVFTVGSTGYQTGNMIAYCWTPVVGYSSVSSYVGNGSSDGPMVYTGFRPKFIMVKRSDASGEPWVIHDSTRDSYNGYSVELYPNSSAAEGGPYSPPIFDFLSNGFKIRSGGATAVNASGGTFIYLAVAESPFQYARAR